ncbi:MAG: glycosyltransferase family 4 protein [Acidobacteria bacterium]|nr:glycosyltransferase family 4 protein [Acidobacteriota bacterium]
MKPLRVAIDTNPLYVTRAGVARYVRGLMRGLAGLDAPDSTWLPLAWEVENFSYDQPTRALKTAFRELIWAPWLAPRRLLAAGTELLHSTVEAVISPPVNVAHVVTLHDLALLRHPERFRRWQRFAGTRRLQRLAAVDHIICISQFTADEAMRLLGLPARRLAVVHNGLDDLTPVAGEPPPAPIASKEFFLFVGSLEPGKNLALLRSVWNAAATSGQPLPPLLIAGTRWQGVPNEGPPPADWHFLGHVPDALLAQLYQRALALVFPSKYEGFGLPVLEAMGRGCPVICSPVASLPEVGGDATWWCALDAPSYLAALRECAQNGKTRDAFVQAGPAQARKFSWAKCATETVAVYRNVLRSR